ncbi:hypothetical protein E2C01_097394 [Portunus trituberculatus]|nr:hypothetical protein [Portunus trituberculatus]
MTFTSEE